MYPSLLDHESVLDLPNVKGMQHDVFMFHHTEPEASSGEHTSHANPFEAAMIADLVEHLLRQGYQAKDIVILTGYLAQVCGSLKLNVLD